ncbi:MAG: hypothetical protein Roseis2KO_31740 [Roseivirga sp.]
MKKISLLLFSLFIFSCTDEADINIDTTEPVSTLENYISARSEHGQLGANPMVIVDGALKSIVTLTQEGFELDETASTSVGFIEQSHDQMLTIFGEAAKDGLVIIRTAEASAPKGSTESFKTDRLLIVVNGVPTGMNDLNDLFVNKIASVHVIKNISRLSALAELGYDGIIQVETK